MKTNVEDDIEEDPSLQTKGGAPATGFKKSAQIFDFVWGTTWYAPTGWDASRRPLRRDYRFCFAGGVAQLTVPRRTVMELAGSSSSVLAVASMVVVAMGPSGSAVRVCGCH